MFSIVHIIGIIFAIALICCAGYLSGKRVKTTKDFLNPAGLNVFLVIGSVMGAVVGGSVTIGTTQSAFVEGLSGMWFTMGAFFVSIVYILLANIVKSKKSISSNILDEFGTKTAIVLNVLSLLSFGISIFSQMASAASLFHSILGVDREFGIIFAAALMMVVVVFGGVWASGIVGIIKTVLIFCVILISGIIAFIKCNGFSGMMLAVPDASYMTLFPDGVFPAVSSGISAAAGMFVTHTYLQAMLSAKDTKTARTGFVFVGILTPIIGFFACCVGIYMKVFFPQTIASEALPSFILQSYPGLLSGFMLGILFITIIVSGGLLTLSMCTITMNGIIPEEFQEKLGPKKRLFATRMLVLVYILVPMLLSIRFDMRLILNAAFLAVAVRAAILIVPYIITLFYPGRVKGYIVSIASCVGVCIIVLGGTIIEYPINSIYIAVAVEVLIILVLNLLRRKDVTQ